MHASHMPRISLACSTTIMGLDTLVSQAPNSGKRTRHQGWNEAFQSAPPGFTLHAFVSAWAGDTSSGYGLLSA